MTRVLLDCMLPSFALELILFQATSHDQTAVTNDNLAVVMISVCLSSFCFRAWLVFQIAGVERCLGVFQVRCDTVFMCYNPTLV